MDFNLQREEGKETRDERRETRDERRETRDERRETRDERRETRDERRETLLFYLSRDKFRQLLLELIIFQRIPLDS
ncbi:hypothetical protein D0812_14115 [Vibrio owensii]|uniref:Uncharacterized protein n=1 Tax=Vibrio owensii TaxID=696485 RepID=A0ABN5Q5Z7_9VIBR|nr:hypothetical protein D0812_14115 [Vibrio owensii]